MRKPEPDSNTTGFRNDFKGLVCLSGMRVDPFFAGHAVSYPPDSFSHNTSHVRLNSFVMGTYCTAHQLPD